MGKRISNITKVHKIMQNKSYFEILVSNLQTLYLDDYLAIYGQTRQLIEK
jgi:hypothetical protein